jgi:hypothetical protein
MVVPVCDPNITAAIGKDIEHEEHSVRAMVTELDWTTNHKPISK